MAEVSLKIPVSFCGMFPKRKIYAVDTCQFTILRSMFNVFIAAFMPEVLVFY